MLKKVKCNSVKCNTTNYQVWTLTESSRVILWMTAPHVYCIYICTISIERLNFDVSYKSRKFAISDIILISSWYDNSVCFVINRLSSPRSQYPWPRTTVGAFLSIIWYKVSLCMDIRQNIMADLRSAHNKSKKHRSSRYWTQLTLARVRSRSFCRQMWWNCRVKHFVLHFFYCDVLFLHYAESLSLLVFLPIDEIHYDWFRRRKRAKTK